jgi:hypothetical protein
MNRLAIPILSMDDNQLGSLSTPSSVGSSRVLAKVSKTQKVPVTRGPPEGRGLTQIRILCIHSV